MTTKERRPDRRRIAELLERELKIVADNTPACRELYRRGLESLPMGVASSYQARDPYPIYAREGAGANTLRLSFCAVAEDKLVEGARRLGAVLRSASVTNVRAEVP